MILYSVHSTETALLKIRNDAFVAADKGMVTLVVLIDYSAVFDIVDHRRAVAQPCVNGDRLSKGRMAKFDLAKIRNPSTDRHKV